MKKRFLAKALAVALGVCMASCVSPVPVVHADNPIIQTNYTADPSPMVYDGTMYLFTSHDEDEKTGFYNMQNWKCYSTTDMVNWRDHGTIMSYEDFEWSNPEDPRAWAPQCVERDGKFYLYVPLRKKNAGVVIGVGVSDSPTGPFVDAIGAPLVDEGDWNDIDPTVYVDDDGQAYLYFGNPNLRYVKLNDDMISYDPEPELSDELTDAGYTIEKGVVRVGMTEAAFGPEVPAEKPEDKRPCSYAEGPWFYKRSNHYYMVYPAFPPEPDSAEHFAYSMSDSPEGPWEYKGILMDSQGLSGTGISFTNHPGVADYMGHSYLFYHNQALPGGGSFNRSVCVDEFAYNEEDGTIPKSDMTLEGPKAVRSLDPYEKTEAETIAWEENVETEGGPREENWDGRINLCDIKNGSYVKVKNVDFGEKGAVKFNASVAKGDDSKAAIGLYLDSADGTQIGQLDVTNTGGEEEYKTLSADVSGATGEHDLYLVFTGEESENSSTLFKFDYWQFEKEPEPEQPTPPAPTQPAVPTAPAAPTAPVVPTVQPPAVSVTTPAPDQNDDVSVGKVKGVSVKKQKGNRAKLSWKKVKGTDGYRIVYSTDKKLKKSVKKASTSKTSCTLKKLSKGKKYYVKVQAYKKGKNGKKVYGSYSAVKKFKA